MQRFGYPRQVFQISTLDAAALQTALSASGPRIVNITAAGTLRLTAPLLVDNASDDPCIVRVPSPTFALMGDRFKVEQSNVYVEGLRSWAGPGLGGGILGRDAIAVGNNSRNIENVIFNHIEALFGCDECFSCWTTMGSGFSVDKLKIINSIIGLPLIDVCHGEGDREHNLPLQISNSGHGLIQIINTLVCSGKTRGPEISSNVDLVEYINSVSFNMKTNSLSIIGSSRANVINSFIERGPYSSTELSPILDGGYPDQIYWSGSGLRLANNSIETNGPDCFRGRDDSTVDGSEFSGTRFGSTGTPAPLTKEEAVTYILANAGARRSDGTLMPAGQYALDCLSGAETPPARPYDPWDFSQIVLPTWVATGVTGTAGGFTWASSIGEPDTEQVTVFIDADFSIEYATTYYLDGAGRSYFRVNASGIAEMKLVNSSGTTFLDWDSNTSITAAGARRLCFNWDGRSSGDGLIVSINEVPLAGTYAIGDASTRGSIDLDVTHGMLVRSNGTSPWNIEDLQALILFASDGPNDNSCATGGYVGPNSFYRSGIQTTPEFCGGNPKVCFFGAASLYNAGTHSGSLGTPTVIGSFA